MQGFVCMPSIYQFEGWIFEWHSSHGPWPLCKDLGLRKNAGRKFWKMIERFEALPKAERDKCMDAPGGCFPLEGK